MKDARRLDPKLTLFHISVECHCAFRWLLFHYAFIAAYLLPFHGDEPVGSVVTTGRFR